MTKPSSTYRVQLRPAFGFPAAASLADYLDRLGVGALYASPMLTPAPGSQHGYDVVDPSKANPELGGEAGRRAMVERLRDLGLKLVVDIVPNHMSVEVPRANRWWWDVLSHGEESRYAHYFDIDFSSGPLLIPVLGDDFHDDQLTVEDGELRYYEHAFPIAEGTSTGTPAEIHQRQHYRLVNWRRGAGELNYRRFFDVANLAAVRVEVPEVFEETHREVLRWVADGDVDGLRVDHPDGLAAPGQYLRRLRAEVGCWLLVEKILEPGERLPISWPVDGTTGYDALREICGVFVDTRATLRLTEIAESLGAPADYPEVLDTSRHLVAERLLGAEVHRIAHELSSLFTKPATAGGEERLRAAVTEILCAFQVYRSYLPEGGKRDWDTAISTAVARRPDLADIIDEIGRQGESPSGLTRLQQTSGMVVAKGTEDTAFYRYNRFVAANEVGGDPEQIGISAADFHAATAEREAGQRHTMTTLSTHDTKRSEDVRARLAALSELPDEFAAAIRRWTERAPLPEPSLNLLGWQTLVGAWPITRERVAGYLDKASKEAKLGTSWYDRDVEFERAVDAWPGTVLGDQELSADIAQFAERIRPAGWSNSLGQKLIQLCAPGIPDVYQGTELWDYSLVDPDNRREVDFAERERILTALERGELPDIDASGAVKMHVVRSALRLRRERPRLFRHYRPIEAEGSAAEHALAFGRGRGTRLVAVATRLPIGLAAAGGWGDTRLPVPEGEWTDLLTGQRYPAPGAASNSPRCWAGTRSPYSPDEPELPQRERGTVTEVSVWAPYRERVRLVEEQEKVTELRRDASGWWRGELDGPASDYAFLLDEEETPLPDPRSVHLPYGVHGPSRAYDHRAYEWKDERWQGKPLKGSVIYELHVGTFTQDGTLASAGYRLDDHLVELGVDFVELLPVNSFDGKYNWGYDGVCWGAVHEPYGGPDGLKAFVDRCHQRGIGVILDVVYNHLGPSGAYLDRFGPYFSGRNIWGPSLNLDGPDSDEVRRFVIDNALGWLRDFHIDGLRLDAVHALADRRAIHLLEELATEVDALSCALGRPLTLIAESDLNDPRLVTGRETGGYGLAAQWSDDLHHALHCAITGESQGYYHDFAAPTALETTLRNVFFHANTWSSFRKRHHGRPVDTAKLGGEKFLAYLQNHDQIGNRATGDRLSATAPLDRIAAAAAIVLCGPYTPMIFMGEEWAASTPWQFFSTFPDPELREIVRKGRIAEFAEHGWGAAEVPDPSDPETVRRSTLKWAELGSEPHATMLRIYRDLIRLRHTEPQIADPDLESFTVEASDPESAENWLIMHRGTIRVICNFGTEFKHFQEIHLGRTLGGNGELMSGLDNTVGLGKNSFLVIDTVEAKE